jgi:hypothetical protein
MKARSPATGLIGVVVLVAALASNTAVAVVPEPCDDRLTVELTPDVPDPELTGPGPDYRCRQAIEAIRRDGHVLSVHVKKGPS